MVLLLAMLYVLLLAHFLLLRQLLLPSLFPETSDGWALGLAA